MTIYTLNFGNISKIFWEVKYCNHFIIVHYLYHFVKAFRYLITTYFHHEGHEELEKKLLNWSMDQAKQNKSKAADMLQLSRSTFRSKLAKYGMDN